MIDHVGKSQQENYPGLTVSRDGDSIVVCIPVRFHRRNGRQMVLTHGGSNGHAAPERETNGSLVSALAKAYRWQEQLESGEYTSLEDLAAAREEKVERRPPERGERSSEFSSALLSPFSSLLLYCREAAMEAAAKTRNGYRNWA